ncbi:MAG: hypothetical protein LBS54_08160 [Dysgonamonadaceae bacterium]|jgi:hypothetical protein|nr:hypothetical protein [Dysgonamonadaceae bacterium]
MQKETGRNSLELQPFSQIYYTNLPSSFEDFSPRPVYPENSIDGEQDSNSQFQSVITIEYPVKPMRKQQNSAENKVKHRHHNFKDEYYAVTTLFLIIFTHVRQSLDCKRNDTGREK